jgi:signal transduction histidine kinase
MAGTPMTTSSQRTRISLRLRLALLVAIVVAAVIATEGFLETQSFERGVRDDLLRTAGATARAVADDLELRNSSQASEIPGLLHDFLATAPTLRDIAVFTGDGPDLTLLAQTSPKSVDDLLPAARSAIARREPVWVDHAQLKTVVEPVVRRERTVGAVAVTTSLAPLQQLGARGRQVTIWFATPAVIVLTLLVDLLARRLVHKPIESIRRTMQRAGAGDLQARATMDRPDEIGDVAGGLNEMLGRIERLQANLQERVDEATSGLRDANTRLVATYQRVSALREQLARAEQLAALGQMAANVAHQVGTPLNLVSGYVQVLIEDAPSGSRALQRLRGIDTQIKKVADAVRSMLDSARRPRLEREIVDVRALVENICEMARPALRAAGVDVHVDAQGQIQPILADPVQLEVALLNLVSNSLDAMPNGGRLEITLAPRPDGLRLTVADTGTGVAADVLPRIFEPWVTTKEAGKGSGLGLSITKEAINSHGGSIAVLSQPERGTIFTIDLPSAGADEGEPWRES